MGNILGLHDLYGYIWIIPLIFSIHELEEWNILKWYKKHYKNMPESTNTSIRIHIIVFSMASFLLTYLAYMARETFIFSIIIVFLSSFLFFNFLQHVIWTVQLKSYSHGLITASLSVIAVVFVNMVLIQNKLISIPFYAIGLLYIPPIVRTVKIKGEMTKEILNVHRFFIKTEKMLKGFSAR